MRVFAVVTVFGVFGVFGVLGAVAIATGCQRKIEVGHERESCRPNHTCEPGLLCLSDTCVRPPQAECGPVAEILASIELGNYAEPEARAPVVAKYREACEAAHVSKDEAACLEKATDRWSAGQCVPRMFPELASNGSGNSDCAEVIRHIAALIAPNVQQVGSDAQRMIDKMLPVMQQSCEQDNWPRDLKACVIQAPPGDLSAMEKCNNLMPKALQDKLQKKLSGAGL